MKIGISFYWGDTYSHIWSNGAGQTMFFLVDTFREMPFVEDVYFVYWGDGKSADDIPENLPIKELGVPLYHYTEVVDTTDVMIEGTLMIDQTISNAFRKGGAKIVSYRMGTDYLMDMEKFVYDLPGGRSFNGTKYDAVWALPQIYEQNRSYLEIVTKAKTYQMPYIWDPVFLNRYVDAYKQDNPDFTFPYQPCAGAKRVSCFEPNISVCKCSFTPILIAEAAYMEKPEAVAHMYACNTYDKREVHTLQNFIGWLDVVKDNILSVEKRHITPYFLGTYTDVVVSHNWELGINNIYYEALYGNYPLVHNSEFLKQQEVGYYYPGFDAHEGARQLLQAIENYDKHLDYHTERNRVAVEAVSPTNRLNVLGYKALLDELYI